MPGIAVDAMSGDNDPQAAVTATLKMAREKPDFIFQLVGKEAVIAPLLDSPPPNIHIVEASEVVGMDEPPTHAIRRRDSSMRRAVKLVATGDADAVVSGGNTGALLGVGHTVIRRLDGVERPVIAAFVPNPNIPGGCCMLDLGANVYCTAAMLQQFARMGAALVRALRGVAKPRVGLLNVGEESFKGREEVREAAALLQDEPDMELVGNVEGFDLYRGDCDVIVCDGFTGNVALKVSEGLVDMMSGMIKKAFNRNLNCKLRGLIAMPVLNTLRQEFDSRHYNGACVLGLRGIVVKSHGNADATAFYSALNYAFRASQEDLAGIIAAMPQNGGVG
ncbi:phosphate acyltransferase PlsX [Candidatus Persebacteraceae bacterium Df01]|uniref:Phosphate acyltransferase n=1 Tax=Candidatus Doriopsillibacter californiensis TaxID=2970740 RepID=A0ABT7QL11_9GAMM|nr:phosphate acyltransferase PlsX [Candidatus Persebacteraceae bacterium Df01]